MQPLSNNISKQNRIDYSGLTSGLHFLTLTFFPFYKTTNAPEFMRLQMAPGALISGEDDSRNEVMSYIFDKGNPVPRRILSFDISVSDTGKQSGLALLTKV